MWDLPPLAPVDSQPSAAHAWWTQPEPPPSTGGASSSGSAAAGPHRPSARPSNTLAAPAAGAEWPAVHAWLAASMRRMVLGQALQAYLAAPERRAPLREESFLKAQVPEND